MKAGERNAGRVHAEGGRHDGGDLRAQRRDGRPLLRVHAVGQKDDKAARQRIDPHRRAREAGVTERAERIQFAAVAGVGRIDVPAEAAQRGLDGRRLGFGELADRERACPLPSVREPAEVEDHRGEARQVRGGGKHAGVAGDAAHVASGRIVHDAAQQPAVDDFGRRDPRRPFRRRIEGGVLHAERQEDLLARELIQRASGDDADNLAQQDEVDVGVYEALAGLGHRLVDERLPDAGFIARPGGLEIEVGPEARKMSQQVPHGDVAPASLETRQIVCDSIVQAHLALLEQLHQRSGGGDHFGERRCVEDRIGGHRLALRHQRAAAVSFEVEHFQPAAGVDAAGQAHGAGDLVFGDGLLDGGIEMGRAGKRSLGENGCGEAESEDRLYVHWSFAASSSSRRASSRSSCVMPPASCVQSAPPRGCRRWTTRGGDPSSR